MKLSKPQIEQLQRSAQNPGRPSRYAGHADAPPPGREPERPERFEGASVETPAPTEKAAGAAQVSRGAPAITVVDWQPVSSAPFDRDLEVRLSDGLGYYSLLYPCRLVANKGWLNALSGTVLTADPIEWRDWQQKATDVR